MNCPLLRDVLADEPTAEEVEVVDNAHGLALLKIEVAYVLKLLVKVQNVEAELVLVDDPMCWLQMSLSLCFRVSSKSE